MSTSVSSTRIVQTTPNQTEYINTLIKENEQLKLLNEKLYKRTLNQKRKLLRIKKLLRQTNMTDEQVKIIDENENDTEPINIKDNVWEDVEEVMASYNIDK
tara:strand:+ start:393 stop:695 length:303 start_codon:yes stop_codon:yes gene_type:complete